MSNSSMKKWLPFESLSEQSKYVNKIVINKNKVDKPLLSEDKIEEINNILNNNNGKIIKIFYYEDGYMFDFEDKIKKIDLYTNKIYFLNHVLNINQIIDIKIENDNFEYFD